MSDSINGVLESVVFSNKETGYMVGRVKARGHKEQVTIVGLLPDILPGESLTLAGDWTVHPKFGHQFKVTSYETSVPTTIGGIEKYLSSGFIRGIGPTMAKRLTDKLGEGTLEILDQFAYSDDYKARDALRQVEGIGEKRLLMIKNSLVEQKEIKNVMEFLRSHGVGNANATKIFKHYGQETELRIRQNPYCLTEIHGIGFLTADKIAQNLSIPSDSPVRIEAGIIFVLNELSGNGHIFYPYEPLIEECRKILGVERELVVKSFGTIAAENKIVVEDLNAEGQYIPNNKAVFLKHLHVSEVWAARNLVRLMNAADPVRFLDLDKEIAWAESANTIKLSGKQAEAVKEALKSKFMVITGGPGTGKTTIINVILSIYRKYDKKILLAAPTGRAAKRMEEVTGHAASTIHRLLAYSPRDHAFGRDEDDQLKADLIVVDEFSMVDAVLMHHLMKAVPSSCTLIASGDSDQLPSVGAGSVLRDVISSGMVKTVKLNEIFRQARNSMIIVNAHRINSGELPILVPEGQEKRDFYFLDIEEPEAVADKVVELCSVKIPKEFHMDPMKDIQVLTPIHKGVIGSQNLNTRLRDVLNPSGDEILRGNRMFRVGDRVYQMVNNYEKEVFNGDIGIVQAIDKDEATLFVNFDGNVVPYDFGDLDDLMLAFATSVHKSQGNQYPAVVMVVHSSHYIMLQRNLLYTGVSRAKQLAVLVGNKKGLAMAVRNNAPQNRHTRFATRITETVNGLQGFGL
ncbi:MAG: ATP-dependent RecD-like DNA helicase [Dissulfurispiraceae bacterium]